MFTSLNASSARVVPIWKEDRVAFVGVVVAASGGDFTIETDSGRRSARRAFGSLVEPELEDRVWLCSENDSIFILSILEREGNATRLRCDGDLDISSSRGSVRFAAAEDVELLAVGQLAMRARELAIRAPSATMLIDRLTHLGTTLEAQVASVRTVARSIDTVADRLSERARRAYRHVSEMAQLRAQRIDYRAESTIDLRGETAMVLADKLMRIDGEQVHVG